MGDWTEDFRAYLPKYLVQEAKEALFRELNQFPENIDTRIYSARLKEENAVFQGDGLSNVWISNLPDPTIKEARVMVISNTCDVARENKRLLGPRMMYCPIVRFGGYAQALADSGCGAIDDHLADVKKQRISSLFYLPGNEELGGECIAMLDRITNCDLQKLNVERLVNTRLFTLSDYGFYLFLFKISIHLTRIREGVSRS